MTMQILIVKRKKREKTFVSRINEQIALARQRIGSSRQDELRWLIRFAYTDLDSLSAKGLEDIGWEFAAFSFDGDRVTDPTKLKVAYADPGADWVGVPEQILRPAHAIIHKGLNDFFFGKGWELIYPEIFERLKVGQAPFRFESVNRGFPGVDKSRILYAFELVRAEWDRLGVCENPRCSGPFVMGKKGRGRFCSPRCNAYYRISLGRVIERVTTRSEYQKMTAREKQQKRQSAELMWKRSKLNAASSIKKVTRGKL